VPTGLLGNTSPTNSYYTWGQLQDMLNSGLVSVGNHTWSHFPMGTKDTAKDQYEVSTAQKELQQYVGKNPITFAYPYGTNAGLSRLYPILAQNGIVGAFSTWGGTVQCDSFMYSLHRTRIGNVPFPAFGIY
ncbi:MAG: polysaccharide deacetylase family protein, partial [Patescibacteria group bacterium]|nr:polysaccharide deacetylase family protein [Patescibacteria group bacterium]